MAKRKQPAGSKFKPEYVAQARNYAELGATLSEMARLFGVCDKTVDTWLIAHPDFREAVKIGAEVADERVKQSLYHNAIGYSHPAVKIFCDPKTGRTKEVPYIEHHKPDTVAGIFWLKNRRPDEWRDVKAVEHSGTVKHKHVSELTDAELAEAIEKTERDLAAALVSATNGASAGRGGPAKGKKRAPRVH